LSGVSLTDSSGTRRPNSRSGEKHCRVSFVFSSQNLPSGSAETERSSIWLTAFSDRNRSLRLVNLSG
jgi:hypothetical protein